MNPVKISTLQKDALQEVMNVGTAHAVNALSQMIGKKIMISVPSVDIIPLNEVTEKIAHSKNIEEVIVGLYFKILGELSGNALLIFPKASAQRLLWMLLKEEQPPLSPIPHNHPIEQSALMEVGNIIINSYLNALTAITDFTLFPSIPHYAEDMLGAVLDYLLIEISKTSDTALFMETKFSAE